MVNLSGISFLLWTRKRKLHLRPITGGTYAVFTYKNGQIVLWHQGPDYESPLNNGAILYEWEGAAPTHTNYYYLILDTDGNTVSQVNFSKYHDVDESGLNESPDYDVFEFDDKDVTKEEWETLTKDNIASPRNAILWNEVPTITQ